MTPEYLSTPDAAAFCNAPNVKAFQERMRRAGVRAGRWGNWKIADLRAAIEKGRRRRRVSSVHAAQSQGSTSTEQVMSHDRAGLHADHVPRKTCGGWSALQGAG
jgi:hypothetical protein